MNCNPNLLQQSLDDRLTEAEEESLSRAFVGMRGVSARTGETRWATGCVDSCGTTLKAACESGEAERSALDLSESPKWTPPLTLRWNVLNHQHHQSTSADWATLSSGNHWPRRYGRGAQGVSARIETTGCRESAGTAIGRQRGGSQAICQRSSGDGRDSASERHADSDGHSSGKLPFIVMPYVACESLQQRLDRVGSLELIDILRIGMQTANGLAAAHAQGLVHRDVKPANILLEISVEKVMLTDFGLARAIDDASITRTESSPARRFTCPPEQARGEPVDARSDLFSLGTVLYTLATGRTPFRAESTMEFCAD